MIKAIIFDFDGVLVESVDIKTCAFAELFNGYGQEIVEKVVDYHLKNLGISRYDKFKYYYRVLLGREISKIEEKILGQKFSSLVENMVVNAPWVSGAKDFLDMYHNELNFYVASGTPDDELKRIIKARNMEHYFRSIFGSSRKKEEILCSILKENQYTPDEVFMVGDAISDCVGAQKAGIRFVGRVPGGHESPFPSKTLFFNNPFQYLCTLLNSEIIQ